MRNHIRPPLLPPPRSFGAEEGYPTKASDIIIGMPILVAVMTLLALGLSALALPA